MTEIRNMSAQEFVDYVKQKHNLFTLKDISEHYGLSKSRVSQWIHNNKIPPKYLKLEINQAEKAPPNETKITKGDGGMIQEEQLNLLAQTQQKTIELMDEKIQLLENNIGVDPIANQIWDDIHADFKFEVAVKIRFSKFDVQKKYTTIGDLRALSKYTGYSVSELREIYETEKWHDSSVSGDRSLYSKGSAERLKNMSGLIIKSIGLFKAMVGEHYIPIPITFIAKDGERKRAMSYSKLNIVKMTGSAKFVFLNGEH